MHDQPYIVTLGADGVIELPQGALDLAELAPGDWVAWVRGNDTEFVTLASVEEIKREVEDISRKVASLV